MIRSKADCLTALITANCVAALAVAVLTWAGLLIGAFVSSGGGGLLSAVGFALVLGLVAALYSFGISFPFFLAGLIVIGIPTWWMLHRTGLRRRGAFIVAGAIESAIVGALVFRVFVSGSEVLAPLLVIPGGLAGWAIWTYGYAPVRRRPARPF